MDNIKMETDQACGEADHSGPVSFAEGSAKITIPNPGVNDLTPEEQAEIDQCNKTDNAMPDTRTTSKYVGGILKEQSTVYSDFASQSNDVVLSESE